MKPVSTRTDAQLEYAVTDCVAAIVANPTIEAIVKYGHERAACQDELNRRERLRLWRKVVDENGHDSLALPLRNYRHNIYYRQAIRAQNGNGYNIDRLRSALFTLGWFKHYGLI